MTTHHCAVATLCHVRTARPFRTGALLQAQRPVVVKEICAGPAVRATLHVNDVRATISTGCISSSMHLELNYLYMHARMQFLHLRECIRIDHAFACVMTDIQGRASL